MKRLLLGLVLLAATFGSISFAQNVNASTPAADAALVSLKAQVQAAPLDGYYLKAGLVQTLTYSQGQFAQNSNYGDVTGCQGLATFRAQVILNAPYNPSLQPYVASWVAQTDAIRALVPC